MSDNVEETHDLLKIKNSTLTIELSELSSLLEELLEKLNKNLENIQKYDHLQSNMEESQFGGNTQISKRKYNTTNKRNKKHYVITNMKH